MGSEMQNNEISTFWNIKKIKVFAYWLLYNIIVNK